MSIATDISKTGVIPLAVAQILGKSAIPWVGVSSSATCSAGGAYTGITALPAQYAGMWVWLPANAAATTIAAGWFWAVPSSTTAGTIYLNQPVAGVFTAPTALIPCTTASSWAGDTGEEFGPTITVPANSMGANGLLRIIALWGYTNSAGSKTLKVRYSGNAGTAYFGSAPTTSARVMSYTQIWNRGSTNSQIGGMPAGNVGAIDVNISTGSADTTTATTVVMSHLRNTATDNAVLESFTVELLSDGT